MVGWLVVLVGIVLLPLPGPGWLVIFLGLGILAAEFVWAERLLKRAKAYYDRLMARAKARRARRSRVQ